MAGLINSAPTASSYFGHNGRFKHGLYSQLKRDFAPEFSLAVGLIAFVYLGHKAGVDLTIALFPFAVLAWVKKRPLWQARIGILVLCGGSDVVAYLYCALLMLQVLLSMNRENHHWRITKFIFLLWLFISLAVVSWMINQADEINLLALPLWSLSFLSPLGVFFYFRKAPLSDDVFYKFLIFLISVAILQCFIAYVDYIGGVGFGAIWSLAVTPDNVVGTFRGPNQFAWFLLEVLAWCYAIIFTHKASSKSAIIAISFGSFLMLFIYTASAKTMFGAFMIGFITVLFFNYRWRLRDRATKLVVAVIIGALILGPIAVKYAMERFDLVYVGYLVGAKSKKLQFMERAIDPSNRSFAHWLIGYGPGTCGSRAADMRAYNLLYKANVSDANTFAKFLPAYSSQCTKRFLADLYDWRYAETASGRSALLGNPFNSWTAIWFELGVVGFLLWGYIFAKILKASGTMYRNSSGVRQQIALMTAINIIAISVAGLITQTIETPIAMMFLWFFAAHTVGFKIKKQSARLPA